MLRAFGHPVATRTTSYEKFDQFQTWASNTQHVSTRCNRVAKRANMLRPSMLRYVALKCCDRLAGALKRFIEMFGIKIKMEGVSGSYTTLIGGRNVCSFTSTVRLSVHTNRSQKRYFSKTLLKPEEFGNVGFSFSCKRKIFWKRCFSKTKTFQ